MEEVWTLRTNIKKFVPTHNGEAASFLSTQSKMTARLYAQTAKTWLYMVKVVFKNPVSVQP